MLRIPTKHALKLQFQYELSTASIDHIGIKLNMFNFSCFKGGDHQSEKPEASPALTVKIFAANLFIWTDQYG